MPRHLAPPEARDLREHEPDPVAGLAAGPELGERPVVDAVLGRDEPLEVEVVGHRDRGSVERGDLRPDRDLAALEDRRPQPGPVDERLQDRLAERGRSGTGTARRAASPRRSTSPTRNRRPTSSFRRIPRVVTLRRVSPGREDDARRVAARSSMTSASIERDVAVDAGRRRDQWPVRGRVAVALEPDAGDRPDALAARPSARRRPARRGSPRRWPVVRDAAARWRLGELVGRHRANSTAAAGKGIAPGRMLSEVRATGAEARAGGRGKETVVAAGSSRRGFRVTPPEDPPLVDPARSSAVSDRTVRRGRSSCVRTGA